MKGIILAAGRGKRMGKLTQGSHKALVNIHGRKLLDIQINSFLKSGISDIGIITGYNSHLLKRNEITKYFHNKSWDKSNMAYSLLMADEWLSNEKCIVSYSDIFYSYSAITSLKKHNSEIAITYDINWLKLWSERFSDPLSDAESFEINSNFDVIKIGTKEKDTSNIKGQYMGLLSFNPTGWDSFKDAWNMKDKIDKLNLSMTDILQKVILIGKSKIKGIPYKDCWGEVDTQNDISVYEKLLSSENKIFFTS